MRELKVKVIDIKPFEDDMFSEFLELDSDFSDDDFDFNKKYTDKFKELMSLMNNNVSTLKVIGNLLEEITSDYSTHNHSQFLLGNLTYVSDYKFTIVNALELSLCKIDGVKTYNEVIKVVVSYLTTK